MRASVFPDSLFSSVMKLGASSKCFLCPKITQSFIDKARLRNTSNLQTNLGTGMRAIQFVTNNIFMVLAEFLPMPNSKRKLLV